MIARIARSLVLSAVVLSMALSGWTARAQDADVRLADMMPSGVAFESLAASGATTFRFHVDALRLDRIRVGCGQATGEIFGMEQIAYVEYGEVDVRDWDTDELIESLSAGQAFGPTTSEQSYYLASPDGRQGSVLRFSTGSAGAIGDDLPDVTYQAAECGSGSTSETAAEPALVETLFASDKVGDTNPGSAYRIFVGFLTVEPGASVGRSYASDPGAVRLEARGNGLILPLVGGFGGGSSGQAGSAGPEVFPGQVAWMFPGGEVALANVGATPTIAFVFGAVPVDSPILAAI